MSSTIAPALFAHNEKETWQMACGKLRTNLANGAQILA